MRILLAEDDPMLGDGLRAGLRQQGFQVDWVRDGLAAERELITGDYQAAVLDLGLPFKDGLDVLKTLRNKRMQLPILVLTARDAVPERIKGLDLGADDDTTGAVDLGADVDTTGAVVDTTGAVDRGADDEGAGDDVAGVVVRGTESNR